MEVGCRNECTLASKFSLGASSWITDIRELLLPLTEVIHGLRELR
jgi:hypothetical protein